MFCRPRGGILTQIEQLLGWSSRRRSWCPSGRDVVFAISTGSHDELDGVERLGPREDKEAVPINEASLAAPISSAGRSAIPSSLTSARRVAPGLRWNFSRNDFGRQMAPFGSMVKVAVMKEVYGL